MGVREWFTSADKKALSASPGVVEALAARQVTGHPPIGGTNLNLQQINRAYERIQNAAYAWLYQYQPAVRSVVDYIARNAAQLGPPKLYERVGEDSRAERPSHPAAETMRSPQDRITPGGFLMLNLLSDFLVYDNAYALKFRLNPRSPLVLLSLPPHCVGIVGLSRFTPEGYNVYRADGSYFSVPANAMVHWHGYNPDDPQLGFSRLETLKETLAEEAAMQSMNTELSKSGLSVPGHIERPLDAPEWSEIAQGRFEEDWANRMKMKERRTPVLEEGMTFKPANMSPKDAEVLKSRQFSREEVASCYGMLHIPPRTEEEQAQFYEDVLAPLLDFYAWFLNTGILQEEYAESDMYFETSLDEKLQGDERLKALTSASGGPILTRNESRKRINLEAKPGGDDLITPLNVTVGGKPSVGVNPIQDPNKPSQEGDHREASAEIEAKDDPKLLETRAGGEVKDKADSNELMLARRAAQKSRRAEYQEELLEMLVRNFDRLERETKSVKAAEKTKSINWSKWEKRLQGELLALAKRIVAREGGIQSVRLGAVDIDMSVAKNWLIEMSKEKAHDIAVAMRDAFKSDDHDEILRQAKDDAGPRAAGTLASGLASFAVHEAADQAPDRERRTKTWIVTSSNSAHPEMDGETVPLGHKFSNGRKGPPADHPGCQCLLDVN